MGPHHTTIQYEMEGGAVGVLIKQKVPEGRVEAVNDKFKKGLQRGGSEDHHRHHGGNSTNHRMIDPPKWSLRSRWQRESLQTVG